MGTNGIDPIVQLTERQKCPTSPTKRKYANSDEAREAARHRTAESGIDIIAYACPGCGLFHLSKKVKGSDVVVPASVGITTGALRKLTTGLERIDYPERRELPPEGPTMPGNPEAKRKALAAFLENREAVSTSEIALAVGIGRHSVTKYMNEIGWKIGRGPGATWRRPPKLDIVPNAELEAAIARHPSSPRPDDWWAIEAFPPGISVQDYLLTLKTAGLVVEVRVRRAP
jgi:hypothetical protein